MTKVSSSLHPKNIAVRQGVNRSNRRSSFSKMVIYKNSEKERNDSSLMKMPILSVSLYQAMLFLIP
jgi:hypothetical protein